MNEAYLPTKRPIGSQLGLGLLGPSIYRPTTNQYDDRRLWSGPIDILPSKSFLNLKIISKNTLITNHQFGSINSRYSTSSIVSDDDIIDSDLLEDEEDDDIENAQDHARSSFISKLQWGRLTPSISTPNMQIYKDIENSSFNNMYDSHQNGPISFHHDYVPKDLLSNITKSDSYLSLQPRNKTTKDDRRKKIVDPTFNNTILIGSIQTSFDLRNDNDYHEVIAYSSGKTGSELKISTIINKKKQKDMDVTKSNFSLSKESNIISLELNSKIKTIIIPKLSKSFSRYSDLIAVITEKALHIIKIKSIDSQTKRIKYSTLPPLDYAEFGNFTFADVAFNPWDIVQFAIIDTKGNWIIGSIPTSFKHGNKIMIDKNISGSIYDPEELSMWKKISWSSNYNRLILMDRSKIIELDFKENWQSEIVQAKSWSNILDQRKVNEDYSFLLTSKEIILLSTEFGSDGATRKLSWKHDLDSNDTTYRLSIQPVSFDDKILYLVYITSKRHNNVYMHAFSYGNTNNIFQSTDNSTILSIPTINKGIQCISFVQEHKGTFTNLSNIQLNLFVKSTKNNSVFNFTVSNTQVKDSTAVKNAMGLKDEFSVTHKYNPVTIEVQSLVESIKSTLRQRKQMKKDFNPSNEFEDFEEYGYRLSKSINAFIQKWDSSDISELQPFLLRLTEPPKYFENLSEFSSLLSQLFDHYKSHDLFFTELNSAFNLLVHDDNGGIDVFYNKLLQCWELITPDSEFLTKELIKSIIWSTYRFGTTKNYKKMEDDTYDSLDATYKDVIDGWDIDNFEDDRYTRGAVPLSSQPQYTVNSQAHIPMIKSSQNKVNKNKASKRHVASRLSQLTNNIRSSQREPASQNILPTSMVPAFTLMSSNLSSHSSQLSPNTTLNSSQPRGSQKKKKKKKKVGGFG